MFIDKDYMSSNKNEQQLQAMELLETYSKRLHTIPWIWGGYTIDVYENRFLREHEDLDYLTLNLHGLIPQLTYLFENDGWQTTLMENSDLNAEHGSVKIQLGHVELSAKACWTHNGEKGSLWFPLEWLNPNPLSFCGVEIHVVVPELQFVLMAQPQLLNPAWRYRDKDTIARKHLKGYIKEKGIPPQSLFAQVSDLRL
jgi:hypothetical protein